MNNRGARGSCLHKTDDGLYLAYSRWPDKKTRDASWPSDKAPSSALPKEICDAILLIKECIDQTRKQPEIMLEVIDDLLLKP